MIYRYRHIILFFAVFFAGSAAAYLRGVGAPSVNYFIMVPLFLVLGAAFGFVLAYLIGRTMKLKPNWLRIFIEAIIIYFATILPAHIIGFFLSFMSGLRVIDPIESEIDLINIQIIIVISVWVVEIIGFTVVGCLQRNNRFSHLFILALVYWGFSFLNFITKPFSTRLVAIYFVHIMIVMIVGGCISLIFVRAQKTSQFK